MKPRLSWSPRANPLAAEGCLAQGEVARELRRNLARRESDPRARFRAVEFEDGLVLLGAELPWVEGLIYLGCVGSLYLPTLWQPDLPIEWLQARLRDLGEPPWVLLPPLTAISLPRAEFLP